MHYIMNHKCGTAVQGQAVTVNDVQMLQHVHEKWTTLELPLNSLGPDTKYSSLLRKVRPYTAM